jgi:hypothetical protein
VRGEKGEKMKKAKRAAVFTVNVRDEGNGADRYRRLSVTVFSLSDRGVGRDALISLSWYSGETLAYWYGFELKLETRRMDSPELVWATKFLRGLENNGPDACLTKLGAMGAVMAVYDPRVSETVAWEDLASADAKRWEIRTENRTFYVVAIHESGAVHEAKVRWAEYMTGGWGGCSDTQEFASWVTAGCRVTLCNEEAPVVRPMAELLAPMGKPEATADVAVA